MGFTERRQGRRVEVLPRPEFRLARRLRVRVVDVSLGGALIASEEPMGAGAVGQLRVPLQRGRFEAEVVVKREDLRTESPPVLLGTAIVSTTPASRDLLEQFLGRSE
jgi:c-di-GMP-binding flagellar brake protein YcgR